MNLINNNVSGEYLLDYFSKYFFYEEEEFLKEKEQGQYILSQLKISNRFDYNNATYTFTKFGNISEGKTERNVSIEIKEDDINVYIKGERVHLDLIYKMDIKKLEDHYRVTTRISENAQTISALLYVKLDDGEKFIKALEKVKNNQERLMNKKD